MALRDITDAFELLLEIERRSTETAIGLPQQVEAKKPWSGIAFRIEKHNLVAAVGDVNEILYFPKTTTIPGTKSWVKGMANIRGTLMPVIDLQDYLGTQPVAVDRNSRILIVHNEELWAGLLVDEVIGLKHFFDDEESSEQPKFKGEMTNYLSSGYKQNDAPWFVFDMKKLTEQQEFLQVSA